MLDIAVTHEVEATVVAPVGDLDLAVAERIRSALTELVDRDHARLLVDLADVSYVDSAGLAALVAAMKYARRAGGDVRLCALQPDVRAIFEVTRLVKVMDIHPSRAAGLDAWR
jgi:anti-sigma B factor antagonist